MDCKDLLDFDELQMYFGEDYYPMDKIKITQPKIGDILEFGDTKLYSVVNTICGNPTSFRLQLWKIGINWNDISDFDLFSIMIKNLSVKDTSLLFGDLNLSWFERIHDDEKNCDVLVYVKRDDEGNPIEINEKELIVIDEIVYIKIVEYIRHMFNIHPKVEHAKNKATAEAIIWEDEMNLENEKRKHKDDKVEKSLLLPMISAALNHPGFKYKMKELRDVGIVEFMDSIQRLQVYESTRALLAGSYSGFMDSSKISKEQFNFMRSLDN